MAQVQQQTKQSPRFGIVYLEGGKSGLKVVHTYTEAPKKIINPDGSREYGPPSPTIHELFGGGFAYADGSPVIIREHLERICNPKMRDRGLAWFDGKAKLSETATKDIPPLANKEDPPDSSQPRGLYVLSTDLPGEKDEVTEGLNKQVTEAEVVNNSFAAIMQSLDTIMHRIDKQDMQIAEIKKRPPAPKRMAMSQAKHSKQSETMRKRWADPEYKGKMLSKMGTFTKWKDKGVGENRRDKENLNGEDATEAGSEVQTV